MPESESNLQRVWDRFFRERSMPLFGRFQGFYRAVVVETNDPLQIHRIRWKCPELHDSTLSAESCPWADRAPWLGGKNAGSWVNPIIGDVVCITFEKGHPYGPIWAGFAMGTRRKRYPLESIYTKSPLAVKEDETADEVPDDYLIEYLPKDRRPMSLGWRDRYGNSEVNSSVGFIPVEHKKKPAPLGQDAVSNQDFSIGQQPEVNAPDKKYLLKMSKYGVYVVHSDVGYYWMKDDNTTVGEFTGDADNDRDFEIKRYKYNLRLLNEDKPNSVDRDQRRYEVRTRAGHKFEMRDVGWAQANGGLSVCEPIKDCKSRQDEYDEPRTLSKWENSDERWIKIRTKGGHIIQSMDMGFHPEEDDFYKRLLIEEIGGNVDGENTPIGFDSWSGRDARQIRMVTRWGNKFVLDDRGTDPRHADIKEKPRGNGWLLKTRRSWTAEATTPRGFGFEASDKDDLDTTRWYTPKSKIIELNDRKDYVMVRTDSATDVSEEWKYLGDNEFARNIGMVGDPELSTYHLKLDKANGYLRLKTAAGADNGLKASPETLCPAEEGLNQGVEARDGRTEYEPTPKHIPDDPNHNPPDEQDDVVQACIPHTSDGAWCELVDIDHRGMWLTRKYGFGIWRSAQQTDQYIVINDGKKQIVIRNNENGVLQIYCKGDVELISEQNIALKAVGKISLKAGLSIDFDAGGAQTVLNGEGLGSSVPHIAPSFITGTRNSVTLNPLAETVDRREPSDRGVSVNGPFETVPQRVIRVCTGQ